MSKKTDCQKDCQIISCLSDVPPGKFLTIRHPLSGEGCLREFSDAELLTDSGRTANAGLPADAGLLTDSGRTADIRLKTETYMLYPGIELSYNYFLGDRFRFHHRHKDCVLSIDHCCRGRIGWEMKGGLSLYFGSGDLSFHATDKCADSVITLPLGYYEGLTVSLDLSVLRHTLPELLRDAELDVCSLCRSFCGEKETAALPASPRIGHIFSEVYDLPEKLRRPYLKLKCQELLLFLSMTGPSENKGFDSFHSEQAEIIRRIHGAMTSDLRKRYTIEELSRQYLINTAALKSVFKSVYGMPVASYMKQYRIMRAAELLRNTDSSVSAVASEVGYESQSKFSAAFKDIMKILPTDYRRQYI